MPLALPASAGRAQYSAEDWAAIHDKDGNRMTWHQVEIEAKKKAAAEKETAQKKVAQKQAAAEKEAAERQAVQREITAKEVAKKEAAKERVTKKKVVRFQDDESIDGDAETDLTPAQHRDLFGEDENGHMLPDEELRDICGPEYADCFVDPASVDIDDVLFGKPAPKSDMLIAAEQLEKANANCKKGYEMSQETKKRAETEQRKKEKLARREAALARVAQPIPPPLDGEDAGGDQVLPPERSNAVKSTGDEAGQIDDQTVSTKAAKVTNGANSLPTNKNKNNSSEDDGALVLVDENDRPVATNVTLPEKTNSYVAPVAPMNGKRKRVTDEAIEPNSKRARKEIGTDGTVPSLNSTSTQRSKATPKSLKATHNTSLANDAPPAPKNKRKRAGSDVNDSIAEDEAPLKKKARRQQLSQSTNGDEVATTKSLIVVLKLRPHAPGTNEALSTAPATPEATIATIAPSDTKDASGEPSTASTDEDAVETTVARAPGINGALSTAPAAHEATTATITPERSDNADGEPTTAPTVPEAAVPALEDVEGTDGPLPSDLAAGEAAIATTTPGHIDNANGEPKTAPKARLVKKATGTTRKGPKYVTAGPDPSWVAAQEGTKRRRSDGGDGEGGDSAGPAKRARYE